MKEITFNKLEKISRPILTGIAALGFVFTFSTANLKSSIPYETSAPVTGTAVLGLAALDDERKRIITYHEKLNEYMLNHVPYEFMETDEDHSAKYKKLD